MVERNIISELHEHLCLEKNLFYMYNMIPVLVSVCSLQSKYF